MIHEAGHLDATDLTAGQLDTTDLTLDTSLRRGHLDAKNVINYYNKNPFCRCGSKIHQ